MDKCLFSWEKHNRKEPASVPVKSVITVTRLICSIRRCCGIGVEIVRHQKITLLGFINLAKIFPEPLGNLCRELHESKIAVCIFLKPACKVALLGKLTVARFRIGRNLAKTALYVRARLPVLQIQSGVRKMLCARLKIKDVQDGFGNAKHVLKLLTGQKAEL